MWYVYRFCRCCCHGANLHREPVFPCKKSEETPHKVCTKECKTDCVQRSRNERSFFMQTEKTRHLRTRVISVLLAVLMIVTCLPSMLFPVSADNNGRSGRPLVLTNASVEFRDSKYNPIDEVNTGDVFYLMSTISGNNVNEGEMDSYRSRSPTRICCCRTLPETASGTEPFIMGIPCMSTATAAGISPLILTTVRPNRSGCRRSSRTARPRAERSRP